VNFNQYLTIIDRLSMQQHGKRLAAIEREILAIAWEGGSYRQIESFQEQTVKNKAVKLWKYLSQLLDTKVNKYNLRQVLEQLDVNSISPEQLIAPTIEHRTRAKFYGRATELRQLQHWVEADRHKLISIYGAKGIGKTTLVHQLVENLAPKLDRAIWISLAETPRLMDVLAIAIKAVGGGRKAKLSQKLSTAIDKTISYLQNNSCLLILDNADLVLDQADPSKSDLTQGYTQFFDRLNKLDGNICCLTITTAKSDIFSTTDRQLELQGLDDRSCQMLLHSSELIGTSVEWDKLVYLYHGNPQYLKIVANTITDIFAGKIENFLDANILVYQPIETLLNQQLDLLSNAEMSILLWLAIEGEPIDLAQLQSIASVSISGSNTIKILDRLVRQYLVEVDGDLFTLPKLIRESVTARYHQLVCEAITAKKFQILHLYPIIPSTKMVEIDRDYVDDKIDKFHQNIKYHLHSIIDRLLLREHFTPPQAKIIASILYPSLQQKMQTRQDLKAGLSEMLMQLGTLESEYIYYPKTQLASRDKLPSGRMPSYAVENLTNLLDGIDRELVS
jgi:DNA replication protein DnaC/DNA-binding MarR family transcriptional regulator